MDHPSPLIPVSTMTTEFDRITIDPTLMNGQPCIRGMRLTVRRVVEAVALYPHRAEIKRSPNLSSEQALIAVRNKTLSPRWLA